MEVKRNVRDDVLKLSDMSEQMAYDVIWERCVVRYNLRFVSCSTKNKLTQVSVDYVIKYGDTESLIENREAALRVFQEEFRRLNRTRAHLRKLDAPAWKKDWGGWVPELA